METRRNLRLLSLFCVALFLPCARAASAEGADWYAGTWDSTIYNLAERPRTGGLRIEIVDAETRIPVREARVSLKGKYVEEKVGRSGGEVGIPREAQEREFELKTVAGKDGVVVFALGWRKEYPWRSYFGSHPPREYTGKGGSYRVRDSWTKAVDDIEKVRRIEIRHPRYRFAGRAFNFNHLTSFGEEGSNSQQPNVFKAFERAWHSEIKRREPRFCVLDLGKGFTDFQNTRSKKLEFFKKIRSKDYGTVYRAPRNWFSKGEHPQSLCGPYFVYTIEIRLEQRGGQIDVRVRTNTPPNRPDERNEGARVTEPRARRERKEEDRVEKADEPEIPSEDKTAKQPPQAKPQPEGVTEALTAKAKASKIGVAVTTLTRDLRKEKGLYVGVKGALVEFVASGSPAEKGGLKAGMVIYAINHRVVNTAEEFRKKMAGKRKGDEFGMDVWRKTSDSKWERHSVRVRLSE